jgi:predicted Zn-dependent peptidase
MKYQSLIIMLASAAILIAVALAQNPVDIIGAPIQEKLDQAQQKVAEHIVEGNITPEHLQEDVNATAEELRKTATQEIQQHTNVTPQDLQKMAEQEIKNQVTQKVQQPGFEAAFTAAGILATAYILRRRN